jgi:toxin ParE1/3/4
LEQIVDYIQRDAPMAAQRLFDRIVEQSKALETFPYRGRVMPELARFEVETLRELIVAPHRLMYRVEMDRVRILAVFDGRRNLEDLILARAGLQQ